MPKDKIDPNPKHRQPVEVKQNSHDTKGTLRDQPKVPSTINNFSGNRPPSNSNNRQPNTSMRSPVVQTQKNHKSGNTPVNIGTHDVKRDATKKTSTGMNNYKNNSRETRVDESEALARMMQEEEDRKASELFVKQYNETGSKYTLEDERIARELQEQMDRELAMRYQNDPHPAPAQGRNNILDSDEDHHPNHEQSYTHNNRRQERHYSGAQGTQGTRPNPQAATRNYNPNPDPYSRQKSNPYEVEDYSNLPVYDSSYPEGGHRGNGRTNSYQYEKQEPNQDLYYGDDDETLQRILLESSKPAPSKNRQPKYR